MKKVYNEYFHVPKDGKIREKVFLGRITLSIAAMVLLLSMMGFTAYAYFTSEVTSGTARLTAARFTLDVTAPEGVTTDGTAYVLDNKNGTESISFEFTLTKGGDATVGYGKVVVKTDINTDDSSQIFYTEPIGKYAGAAEPVNSRTITIEVPEGKETIVEFIAEWGSCSQAAIVNNTIEPIFKQDSSDTAGISDDVVDTPTEGTDEESADDKVDTDTTENKLEGPTTQPTDDSTGNPVEEPVDDKVDTDTTEDKPEGSTTQPTDDSTTNPIEEPTEDQTEKPTEGVTPDIAGDTTEGEEEQEGD